jgi:DsbC/DsbD-like thiol-disulfide interchange protein
MPLFLSALLVAMLPLPPTETMHLKVITSVSDKPARGGQVSLFVDVEPKASMHVYAPGQDGFIVVTLTLEKDPAFTAATPKFPAPEKLVFEPLNETQLVYSKPFRIVENITRAKKGPLTIKGTLRYQACDDKVCFRPSSVPVEWTLR